MVSAIVDNSTISALQRLTGKAGVPSRNYYDIQGDVSALEAFLNTLLFYDDFYFIDDYISEHQASRAEHFPFLRPLRTTDFPYDMAIDKAKSATEDLMLDIRGGRMHAGLVKEFLESIGLHLTAAWHMQSSDFFLTLKILSSEGGDELRDKYSPLTALIFNQTLGMSDKGDCKVNLMANDGSAIGDVEEKFGRTYQIQSDLLSFASSLNWLTHRSVFYLLAAANFSAALSLHPIRHNFIARWAQVSGSVDVPHDWRENVSQFFGSRAESSVNSINEWSDSVAIDLRLPTVTSWAVGSAGSVSKAIKFVCDTRSKPEAIRLRSHLSEIDQIRLEGNVRKFKKELGKLKTSLEEEALALQRKYGKGETTSRSKSISVAAQLLPYPSLQVAGSFELPQDLNIRSKPAVRTLFRNIVDDIVAFDSLGHVRGLLARELSWNKNAYVPKLRVEDKKFFGRGSGWKEPM